MIPRTKVNYTLNQLVRALFTTEGGRDHKSHLVSLLRDYFGEKNILLTPSGRGALYYILKATDKSRVLVPAYTCNAVVEAALLAGKEVVFADVEEDGFNMDVSCLDGVIDEYTAVIGTHQFGIPCNIERIIEVGRQRGALIIEDAAASLGSRVNGKLTGTFGDVSFFSFDSTKLVNVPLKGGFLIAKDPLFLQKIEDVRRQVTRPMPLRIKLSLLLQAALLITIANHALYRIFYSLVFALRNKYTAETAVLSKELDQYYIYELANWQAFIASKQIEEIDRLIRDRQRKYAWYREKLSCCSGFELPPVDREGEWSCIRFPVCVCGDKFAYYRRAAQQGIDFAFSFTFIVCPEEFVNARRLAVRILDLPFYSKLTERERSRVVSVLTSLDGEVHRDPE